MSNYTDKIMELVQQRPDLRSVQISDLLDIDLDIVENTLALAVREEKIVADEIKGANGLLTKTYRWAGVAPLGWVAPKVDVTVKPAAQQKVHTEPAVAESTAQTETTAAPAASRSKASIAIDHLVLNGPTDRATLMTVMGLEKKFAIEQYLKPHVKSGKVVRIDDVYCVPDRSAAPPAAAAIATDKPAATAPADNAAPVSAADPVHSPIHYTAGGIEVIDILRAKLTPEEFRGFLKGNVIKYMLRAEHKGGAQDYKKGSVYASWLADAVIAAPATQVA